MKKRLIGVCLIAFLSLPGLASAWDNEFHVQMVKDAIALCPTELKKFLNNNSDAVITGAKDPDITISAPIGYAYGYRKHYYIPEGDRGDGPDEVKALSVSTIDLLSRHFPDTELIGRRMGMISHFIGDSLEPKRYVGLAPNYPKDFIKEQFRSKDVTYLPVIYNGYNPIDDFSGDLKTIAKNFWYQNTTDDQYYDVAVNSIVDTWTTIWEKAGRPSGDFVATGSRIRPEVPPEVAKPAAVFSPSELLDLKTLGETGTTGTTGTYDEKTFDIDKYGKGKELTPQANTGEAPLESTTNPGAIENATGTPPPPGATTPPEEGGGESPSGETGETSPSP